MVMTEAEVSLRLAFHLLRKKLTVSNIKVAIDGAQVQTRNDEHFKLRKFLSDNGWEKVDRGHAWLGEYLNPHYKHNILIHSNPGQGDIVADLLGSKKLHVECKKSPGIKDRSNREYKLLREAIGQLIVIPQLPSNLILAAAVPDSEKYCELAQRWRNAPLIKRVGIQFLTVSRNNEVSGLKIK